MNKLLVLSVLVIGFFVFNIVLALVFTLNDFGIDAKSRAYMIYPTYLLFKGLPVVWKYKFYAMSLPAIVLCVYLIKVCARFFLWVLSRRPS